MDMQTPDHDSAFIAPDPLSRIFTKRLLQGLAATMPGANRDDMEQWGERWEATRELFDSLDPRNPADAQLAAIAVAAAQSSMDNFARASRPGVSDEAAVRLRSSGLSAGRTYASVLRYLRKSQRDAASATQAVRPVAAPTPLPAPPVVEPEAPEIIAPQSDTAPSPVVRLDQVTRAQRPAPNGPTISVLQADMAAREAAMAAAIRDRGRGKAALVGANGSSG